METSNSNLTDDASYSINYLKSSSTSEDTCYGGLFVIGFNGRGRKSKFIFKKRKEPNGVRKAKSYTVKTAQLSQVVCDPKSFSISYAFSDEETIVVEYEQDNTTDMFQIGRSNDEIIDFRVLDKYSGETGTTHQSTVSRFAFRIISDRSNPSTVQLYAGGYNSHKNIFLGVKAVKWKKDDGIDGLTTNGVLLCNPEGTFCGGDLEASVWREVSVCGNILSVRGPRSSQEKGREIKSSTNILKDGSLIDICGVTLLWRSSEGLKKSANKEYIERLIQDLNSDDADPKNYLVIPRRNSSSISDDDSNHQPQVYVNCGHVHGGTSLPSCCPTCHMDGPTQKLFMGMEPAFYVDDITDTTPAVLCAFNPCGHIATEKTVKYWSKAPLPHGTCAYRALCPFCATELQGYPGYVCLKFKE